MTDKSDVDASRPATLFVQDYFGEPVAARGRQERYTDDIEALASWDPKAEPSQAIAFTPSRILLQDFTGVPAVVNLTARR